MTLGERISNLRKEKNYSQEYLAQALDISRQAVYKWEKDLSSPDTAHLIKLAELLGVSVEYLATGKNGSVIVEKTTENEIKKSRKKKSRLFKAMVSIICVFSVILISSVVFIATRDVSFDAGGCSGGFKTAVWHKYKDELFEKYLDGFNNDNCNRELIEDSRCVIFKDKTIVFFFDVAVTDENGNEWIDYVHITGKRIWTWKYILGNCVLSEKLSPENYFGIGDDGE